MARKHGKRSYSQKEVAAMAMKTKSSEKKYLKISEGAMNTMLSANKAGKTGIGVRAFEHELSARMLAGRSKFEVGTKVVVTGLKGEDVDLNGLSGELTHPFPGLNWPGYTPDVGVYLDEKSKKKGVVNGGIINLSNGDFKPISDKKGISPMAKIDVALDTKSPTFEADAKLAQKKIAGALRKVENKITLNKEEQLYVLRNPRGYSAHGFEVVRKEQEAVANWLGRPDLLPKPEDFGTVKGYNAYRKVMDLGGKHAKKTGQKSTHELVPQLVGLEGKRVEVVDAYGEKRRFYVGKSTGWVPVHLEIPLSNSRGGIQAMGVPFKSVKVIGER